MPGGTVLRSLRPYHITEDNTRTKDFKIRARHRVYEGLSKESRSANELVKIIQNTLLICERADKQNTQSEWKGPFFFIQAADTQFGMIESYLEKKPDPKWDKEIVLTRQAIAAVNRMNPKPCFFVVCGDLIDAMPGTDLRKPQEDDFRRVMAEMSSEVPLVCVCGNHDIGNEPTPESVRSYRDTFGDDYFVFWCGGVMCIVINSQYYENSTLVRELEQEQSSWLDEQLEEAKSGGYKHVVVFQHIPWFLRDPGEEKEYFNIVLELRQKMLEKFHRAGVRAIFCGHYHRNAGGFYKDMELVVTSAVGAQLGNDCHGLRIVKLLDDKIQHQYYKLSEIPETVEL